MCFSKVTDDQEERIFEFLSLLLPHFNQIRDGEINFGEQKFFEGWNFLQAKFMG